VSSDCSTRRPNPRVLALTTVRVLALLSGLAAVAWASGRPFVFPSLGPSAYALAVSPSAATSQQRRVVGGHVWGLAGGLIAYHLLVPGFDITAPPPALSPGGLLLAASALLSVGVTTAGMLATDLRHPPACATTLIVALGLLTTPVEAVIVLLSVVGLVGVDRLLPDVPP